MALARGSRVRVTPRFTQQREVLPSCQRKDDREKSGSEHVMPIAVNGKKDANHRTAIDPRTSRFALIYPPAAQPGFSDRGEFLTLRGGFPIFARTSVTLHHFRSPPSRASWPQACVEDPAKRPDVTNQVHKTDSPSGIPTLGEMFDDGYRSDEIAAESVTDVNIRSLRPGTVLTVDTVNSSYRIVVLNGEAGLATMEGGELFDEPTEVRIEGSTAGGSELRVGWIHVGLRLELFVWRQRVVTSRVRGITVEAFGPSSYSIGRPGDGKGSV